MDQTAEKRIFDEPIPELIEEHRGIYLIVNAMSRRVRQLQEQQFERNPLSFPTESSRDLIAVALQEFKDGKILVVPRTAELHEPDAVEDDYDESDEAYDAATSSLDAPAPPMDDDSEF